MTNARVQGDLEKLQIYRNSCISKYPECLTFCQVNHPVKHFHVNSNFWLKDKSRRVTLNAGDMWKSKIFSQKIFGKTRKLRKFMFGKRRFE